MITERPQYELQDECGQTVELFNADDDSAAVAYVHRHVPLREERSKLLLLRVIELEEQAELDAARPGELGVDTEATEGDG